MLSFLFLFLYPFLPLSLSFPSPPFFYSLTPFFSSFSPSLSLSLFLLPFPFTRPLFIVGEDQKLTIKKSHIYKIRNSRGNVSGEYGWHDVLYEVRTCVFSFDYVACGMWLYAFFKHVYVFV